MLRKKPNKGNNNIISRNNSRIRIKIQKKNQMQECEKRTILYYYIFEKLNSQSTVRENEKHYYKYRQPEINEKIQ